MARNLQDVREAIEPQQVQAHRRRGKCYIGLSHQKKLLSQNVTECFAMIIMLHKECVPLVLTHDIIIYYILFITMRYL